MSSTNTYEHVVLAAYNNAEWCNTVCAAHGKPGQFLDSIWLNDQQTPPFYPNAVTFKGASSSAEQLAAIHTLLDAGIEGEWAVKDSFCTLDLNSLGFQLLFEATWIWRPAATRIPMSKITGVEWRHVQTASELTAWEEAWSGTPVTESEPAPARIFQPTLLTNNDIAFIAAYRDQQIVAGCIANRTGKVVGLSNVFTPRDAVETFWAGCTAEAFRSFPGLPLVGYEAGPELALALAVGFQDLEALRIWGRSYSAT